MEYIDKEVRFDEWCQKCKYKELGECCTPCRNCLDEPINSHSTKPLYWEEEE